MKLVFNKKVVLLLGALLVVVASALGLLIRAWLTDEELTPEKTVTVGNVEFVWAGDIGPVVGYVVPGQNLVTEPFTLTNASTVATELRVKIEVVYGAGDTNGIDLVDITFGEASGWVYNETDGYHYYQGTDATLESGKYKIAAGTQTLNFVSSIVLDGSQVGNGFTDTAFTITFTFQAKQNDYIAWSDMGSIDFTEGI
ncbi:MAG: hypothetical protein WC008_04720 [Bacilli bacterium]